MSMSRPAICIVLATALLCVPADGRDGPRFGKPADTARIAAWDIDVSPDGTGLPPGSGSVVQGARLFAEKCAMCHGAAGAGQPADRLTGGVGTLRAPRPIKTVASYWPYATTLFSYISSAMPINDPQSLTPDEVYALLAYLLSIDGIVGKDAVLDAGNLAEIRMPNRDGFRNVWDHPSP